MIITKTPFRMSFFGGGTDMKEFFQEYGGAVLSTTFPEKTANLNFCRAFLITRQKSRIRSWNA